MYKYYYTVFYICKKYLHIARCYSVIFFLQLHSVISSSCKRISYVYLYVVLFSFLSKSDVQDTNDSCLPGFVSWETPESNSFSKIWDKIVTVLFCFVLFYCSQNYILLSNYIRDSVYLKTVSSCSFVSPLPLIELRSIFPLKDT